MNENTWDLERLKNAVAADMEKQCMNMMEKLLREEAGRASLARLAELENRVAALEAKDNVGELYKGEQPWFSTLPGEDGLAKAVRVQNEIARNLHAQQQEQR